MSEPLFHTDCPSCGAPISVHSATAVTVVCSYCSSMLVRQDQTLADSGRDSALLQDFSPIQIGTQGHSSGHDFTVIGRLQVRYDAGVWNEWYLRFNDGSAGWLSEAGDLYVLVRAVESVPNIPDFDSVRAGETAFDYRSKHFIAADVREIELAQAAAEGELPFPLPENSSNRVIDWRNEQLFLTTDYAESPPALFVGKTVRLGEMALQNTRDTQTIRAKAGSLKGSRHAENCPNCGGSIAWPQGVASHLICPSCGSDLAVSSGKAQLLAANAMRNAQLQALTIPIGSSAIIKSFRYTVIGAIRREEIDAAAAMDLLDGRHRAAPPGGWWYEYLLYAPERGFLWLVESPEDGFSLAETLNEWPRTDHSLNPHGLQHLYDYGGRVSFAVGAFYWHIRAGDITHYRDYRQGSGKLSAERSYHELAWSQSTPVPYQQIQQWFGLKGKNMGYTAKMQPESLSLGTRLTTIGVFLIINLPAWLMINSEDMFDSLLVSAIIIYMLWSFGNSND